MSCQQLWRLVNTRGDKTDTSEKEDNYDFVNVIACGCVIDLRN